MNIPTPRTRRRNLVSITPLIDVVFILLFFFMLASSFDRWREIDITLAAGTATVPSVSESRLLPVRAGAEVEWQGEWLAAGDLIAGLAVVEPGLVLVLQPRPGTPIQDLVLVLESIRAEGRHQVSLAVTR